ncbi:armadillo-type protein [Podospora didyma]|uniref:Armadillo-type protein n=1 Tax=Podospora didyma TaxID=330526 RepID=A0AAE0U1R2_9PEZI|nr:armadillo-type protein [Podospora didyma]
MEEMMGVSIPPIFAQLRNARSYLEQANALRALKNDTIGHSQRKEKWVEYGILEPLVKILYSSRSPARSNSKESLPGRAEPPRALAHEELVRLLCLQLLASFASGGPAYLPPIYAAGAIPVVYENILAPENPPQVVLAALRVFSDFADAARLAPPKSDYTNVLSDTLFGSRYLDTLCAILDSDLTDQVALEQKHLVASLIGRLCREKRHQNALAGAGLLDALATMLAAFVVARGEVVPGAELMGQADGLDEMIPGPAPRGASLAVVLEAIAAIIAGSRFRACLFMSSPAIIAVFAVAEFSPPAKETKAAWNTLEMSGLGHPRARGAIDYLLPVVPITQPRSLSSQFAQFPPLGYALSRESLASATRPGLSQYWSSPKFDSPISNSEPEADDPESPLIPWLINLTRATGGLERAMAASVLASLFKAGFANPEREAAVSHLVVPLLYQLLKDHIAENAPAGQSQYVTSVQQETAVAWAILEQAPEVMARLVADSEFLQEAARECGVLEIACSLLKHTYEPMEEQSPPRPWSPNPDRGIDSSEGLATCRIGPPGQLPFYAHTIKMRESSLKLVAAMGTFKEDYRKELVEQEVVQYATQSLSSKPTRPLTYSEMLRLEKDKTADVGDRATFPYGLNPKPVIIAACHVIRTLSRSTSNLRTVLEDNKVAMPIFRLLRHSDAEVQIAACSAVCNLLTSVSPMRKTLLDAGILKILCEHAHSLNPGLRLNSLWALKHMVQGADIKTKKDALEELESGWLIQLICDDTEDEALHARMMQEQRDFPDADNDEDMDTEVLTSSAAAGSASSSPYEDNSKPWLWPAIHRDTGYSRSSRRFASSPRMQKVEAKLATLREQEVNPTRKARNDDLAIQEQAINFIRNLTGPPTEDVTDMVDYVFSELGEGRLFDILASKLRVRVLHPFARRSSARGGLNSESRVLYPQANIITAVVYLLVHIVASVPRHRQLVIAQTELIKQLGHHLSNKDIGVRRALCQFFINIVWKQDDATDLQAAYQRAQELKKLGFLAKLEGMEQADCDLEVRQKAKEAAEHIKNNNHGGSTSSNGSSSNGSGSSSNRS